MGIKIILLATTLLIATLSLGACQLSKDPQAALEEANKVKAIYCMNVLENQHDLKTASQECFGDSYIQHSPHVPDGKDAVLSLFSARFKRYPEFSIEIKRSAADGDLVWIHLHSKMTPKALGGASIHIFRMKDGKFVEHWGVNQPVPKESANDNKMF